jgi:alpha-tubulin suppressor-like RCC1 family protein
MNGFKRIFTTRTAILGAATFTSYSLFVQQNAQADNKRAQVFAWGSGSKGQLGIGLV